MLGEEAITENTNSTIKEFHENIDVIDQAGSATDGDFDERA